MLGWKCIDCQRSGEGEAPDYHIGHEVEEITIRKCRNCNSRLKPDKSCPGCDFDD